MKYRPGVQMNFSQWLACSGITGVAMETGKHAPCAGMFPCTPCEDRLQACILTLKMGDAKII